MAYIPPTSGRVVLFWPRRDDNIAKRANEPLSAIICAINSETPEAGESVNLCVFDANGRPQAYQNIRLLQEGDVPPAKSDYAEWMLYQKGQAAKTEAAEAALAAASSTLESNSVDFEV